MELISFTLWEDIRTCQRALKGETMSDCFLYFRLWPGFTDPFPVDRFNGIANDQDLLQALDDYALGEIARPEIRLQVKQVASTRRKNLLARLKRQSARRSPAGFGNASVRKRLTKRDWYWPRIRHADRRDPLVCRLGAYLGWWQKRWDESFPIGAWVWFYRVTSQELAEAFVSHLNGRNDLEYDGHELEYYLSPRFGFVENSDTALRITAMRSINAIRRGKVLDIRAGKSALAMGQMAMGIADEMLEALAPPESSQPVSLPTTLNDPSGSGDADAEAKPTPTVADEAVEAETTESTTTEQKKLVIESDHNKKTQSNDEPHRTTQKSQSETVQLTEELKVVAFLTDGVSNEVVEKVASIIRSSKKLEDKLHQVDQIIKIPAKGSRRLGRMFGVSHTAIQGTDWWQKNHKSEEDRYAGREARLKERGKRSGLLPNDDE